MNNSKLVSLNISSPNITWDFILLDGAKEYEKNFKKIREKNRRIGSIVTVISNLYPGELCFERINQKGKKYRTEDTFSEAEYYFIGNNLNPKNGLIIFTRAIRYGRKFRQLCDVLQTNIGRNLRTMEPPTFACICKLWDKENFNEIIAKNLIVPVIDCGWTYLPTLGNEGIFE